LEVVAEFLFDAARARTMPRASSSSRSASRASTAVISISMFASALSSSQRTGVPAASTAASARRRKFSALAKNSGES
jgi:hypothetical protein